MTRKEKRERRERVREMYKSGMTAREISERVGITYGYVCMICSDISVRGGQESGAQRLRNHEEEVKQMRLSGVTTKEIAQTFNVSNDIVKTYLRTHNIKLNEYKNSEEEASRRIYKKTGGKFEYVSGYKNKDSAVIVRCTDCGKLQTKTYHHLTTAKHINCEECLQRRIQKNARTREEEAKVKEAERLRRRKEKEEEAERRRIKRETPHHCPVCGTMTTREKYCSDNCRNKAYNATKEAKRRKKIQAAMIDKDITVAGLFKRDAGICHICGTRCNMEDYTTNDGTFIAGDWYPSIDHVVPLVKGGSHSWSNVKLAHRRCNYLKRDKLAD